jgi:hypothetical protein
MFNNFKSKFNKIKEYQIPTIEQEPPNMTIIFSTGVIFEQADKVIMNKILNYFDQSESSYLPFKVVISNYKDEYVKLIEQENVIENGNYHLLMIEHFETSTDSQNQNSEYLRHQATTLKSENTTEKVFIDFDDITDEIINLNNKYAVEGHIFKSYNDKDYVFSGVKRDNLGTLKRQFIQDVDFDFQKELNKDLSNDIDITRQVSKKNQRSTLMNEYINTNRRKGKSLRERINEDIKNNKVDNLGGIHKKTNDILYDYVRKQEEQNIDNENGFTYVLDNQGKFEDCYKFKEPNHQENYENNNIIAHLYDTWY